MVLRVGGFRVRVRVRDSQVVSLPSTLLPHLFLGFSGVRTAVAHMIPGITAEFLTVKGWCLGLTLKRIDKASTPGT